MSVPLTIDRAAQWVFLVNPTSGNPLRQRRLHALLNRLEQERQPGSIVRILTENPGHMTKLAEGCQNRFGEGTVLFICGGDGSIHEAVNGILSSEKAADPLPMVVIPTGTGNDYARHLYGDLTPAEVLDGLQKGVEPSRADVIRVGDRYCANVMSFGLDTRVQMINEKLSDKAPILGSSSFILSSLAGLFGPRSFHMEMELDTVDEAGTRGTVREELDYVLLAVCNAAYYGGGFEPTPGASSSDGTLDLCLVHPVSLPGLLALLPKYRKGTHIGHPAVRRFSVSGGTLHAPDPAHPLLGNMDGETFTSPYVDFRCVPDALNVYRLV